MSAAFFYHDLTCTRQGALSGLRELQQLSCQGMDALLVHQNSFQVRLVDEDYLIKGGNECPVSRVLNSAPSAVTRC